MYQEIEMHKVYKKEKADKIQHNHEKIASISALTFFAVLAILVTIVT